MMPLKRNIMVLRNPVHPIFLLTALRLKDKSKVVIKICPIYDQFYEYQTSIQFKKINGTNLLHIYCNMMYIQL